MNSFKEADTNNFQFDESIYSDYKKLVSKASKKYDKILDDISSLFNFSGFETSKRELKKLLNNITNNSKNLETYINNISDAIYDYDSATNYGHGFDYISDGIDNVINDIVDSCESITNTKNCRKGIFLKLSLPIEESYGSFIPIGFLSCRGKYFYRSTCKNSGKTYVKNSGLFKCVSNEYGGNQSNPVIYFEDYINGDFDDDDLKNKVCEDYIAIVRKYYPNATKQEIYEILQKYESVGCGYITLANAIVDYSSSQEDGYQKFYENFGYYYCYDNGDTTLYNTESLALDIFLYTTKAKGAYNVDLVQTCGNGSGCYYPIINYNYYSLGPIFFYKNYGYDINYTNKTFECGNDTDEFNEELVDYIEENENCYIEFVSLDFDMQRIKRLDQNNINYYSIEENYEDVGCHSMLVTGIDDNGYIHLSSWGDEFIYKPKEDDDVSLRAFYIEED